jgi:hypothetical protein
VGLPAMNELRMASQRACFTNLRSPAFVSELRLASQRAHLIIRRRLSTVAAPA